MKGQQTPFLHFVGSIQTQFPNVVPLDSTTHFDLPDCRFLFPRVQTMLMLKFGDLEGGNHKHLNFDLALIWYTSYLLGHVSKFPRCKQNTAAPGRSISHAAQSSQMRYTANIKKTAILIIKLKIP